MAATVTFLNAAHPMAVPAGFQRRVQVTLAFDNSYPTGGYAITPAQFGLGSITYVDPSGSTVGRPTFWVSSTGKIKVFSAVSTEISNTTDLSADSCTLEVVGY